MSNSVTTIYCQGGVEIVIQGAESTAEALNRAIVEHGLQVDKVYLILGPGTDHYGEPEVLSGGALIFFLNSQVLDGDPEDLLQKCVVAWDMARETDDRDGTFARSFEELLPRIRKALEGG